MKLRLLLLSSMLALVGLAAAQMASAQAPSGATQVAGGLLSPRGLKMGPDGFLYVAEAGTGGDTKITVDGSDLFNGFTGRISKIDPATGARTTVAGNLPSQAGPEGDTLGPADVAFIGNQLYYVQTHGGAGYGFPDNPTGVYKVNSNGSVTLLADIGKFNLGNPIADISSGRQLDNEIGGNPYAMTVRDGAFLVVDGNQNQVMKITTDGAITRLAEFSGHPVTTGIATQASGPLYVGALGQFPFTPQDGNVYRVGYPTGNINEIADGFSSVTDVEFGPGGQLYALTFDDQAADLSGGIPWIPMTGKLLKVSDGKLTPVFEGLNLTSAVIFVGDTAYISNNGVSIPGVFDGEIVKIENVSSLAPIAQPAPQPAAGPPAPVPTKPTGVITAPDTGTGDGAAGGGSSLPWVILALGAVGAMSAGAAVVVAKR